MNVLKISLFHSLCSCLSICITAFNLTFSHHRNTEIVLYTLYSILIILLYFIFGYKFIETSNNIFKTHAQIRFISIILVIVSFMDIRTTYLLNLPFQPLFALFCNNILNEKTIGIISALFPSILMQAGYICKLIKLQ